MAVFSWTTGNMIIENGIRQMCVPVENIAYFGDGDTVSSNPGNLTYWNFTCPGANLSHTAQFLLTMGDWKLSLLNNSSPNTPTACEDEIWGVHHHDHGQVITLRPRQNGRYFADDIFKCIFLNENAWILLKISLKFVPKVRIDTNSSIGSDNGLAPARRQAITWTNDG